MSVRGSPRSTSSPAVPIGAGPLRVSRNSPKRAIICVAVGQRLPPAVVVEGEGDVAQLVGEPGGPGTGVVVESRPLVAHEDARSTAGAFGKGEGADHRAAVGLIRDVAGGDHGRTVPALG